MPVTDMAELRVVYPPPKATSSSSSANPTSTSLTSSMRITVKYRSKSKASTCSTQTPARSAVTTLTASPAGSSIPTTTKESFFVRHAYFLGANDPYKALRTTLKAEINQEAWETLHSDTSRPFEKPKSGRIAVKVINHLGDEVMKVFRMK